MDTPKGKISVNFENGNESSVILNIGSSCDFALRRLVGLKDPNPGTSNSGGFHSFRTDVDRNRGEDAI